MTAMTFDSPLSSPRPSSVRASRPVRLTRRGRLLVLLTLVTLVLVAFSLGRTSADARPSGPSTAPRSTVVQPGETLWAIAHRVAPGADPRDVVTQLADLNGLDSAPIVAGQRLLLPG